MSIALEVSVADKLDRAESQLNSQNGNLDEAKKPLYAALLEVESIQDPVVRKQLLSRLYQLMWTAGMGGTFYLIYAWIIRHKTGKHA